MARLVGSIPTLGRESSDQFGLKRSRSLMDSERQFNDLQKAQTPGVLERRRGGLSSLDFFFTLKFHECNAAIFLIHSPQFVRTEKI